MWSVGQVDPWGPQTFHASVTMQWGMGHAAKEPGGSEILLWLSVSDWSELVLLTAHGCVSTLPYGKIRK